LAWLQKIEFSGWWFNRHVQRYWLYTLVRKLGEYTLINKPWAQALSAIAMSLNTMTFY
jgi:hypothetical protein